VYKPAIGLLQEQQTKRKQPYLRHAKEKIKGNKKTNRA
jgi:hypothetical protein